MWTKLVAHVSAVMHESGIRHAETLINVPISCAAVAVGLPQQYAFFCDLPPNHTRSITGQPAVRTKKGGIAAAPLQSDSPMISPLA